MAEKHKILSLIVSDVLADALIENANNAAMRHSLLDLLLVQVGIECNGDGGEQNEAVLKLVSREQSRFVARVKSDRAAWRNHWTARTSRELQENSNGTPMELQENSNGTPPLSVALTDSVTDSVAEVVRETRAHKQRTMEPPTAEAVQDYARREGLDMDAARFCDHYAARGWKMRGGVPMKDWKAAARNWARREADFKAKTAASSESHFTGENTDRFKGDF